MKLFLNQYLHILSYFLLVLSTTSVNLVSCEKSSVIVDLGKSQGKLQGVRLQSRIGRDYFGFLGIPFGHVSKRFADSEPVGPWEGIKVVDQLAPLCYQEHFFGKLKLGQEDCLSLNLYTPTLDDFKKLPVIVYIYPGGFQNLGANLFEGQYIMDEDVVFVTINYRLGALGFLDTTDGEVGGNMGLKDQTLALKWIQKNIDKFGGDPNSVTVIGCSAGAASVGYHLISDMSKGLLHRAVALSGSPLNSWALQYRPKELFRKFASNANCTRGTTKSTVECLRSKGVDEINEAQVKLARHSKEYDLISMKFVPTVESQLFKGPKFLIDTPHELIKSGKIANKVPLMTGFTQNEGGFYTAMLFQKPESVQELNSEWNVMAPNIFYYEDNITPEGNLDEVSKSIKKFYFGEDMQISMENKDAISDIYSDRFFNNGIIESISLLSQFLPAVYPYYMNYQGNYSGIQFDFPGVENANGVAHADEILYMFNQSLGYPSMKLGTDDGSFSEKYIKLLVSFAKDGFPSATWGTQREWSPVDPKALDDINLYEINLKDTRLVRDPLKTNRKFWASLPLIENQRLQDDKQSTSSKLEKEEL